MKRNKVFIFIGLIGTLLTGLPLAHAASVAELFSQANQAYQDGKYKEAIQLYESILAEDKQSAALYFNLGNAYKKAGQLGASILNYERALLLAPRDADIKANRRFVLAEARVSRKTDRESFLHRKLNEHVNFYSYDEMIMVTIVLVFGIATLILFRDRFNEHKVTWIILLVVFSTFVLIFTAGFLYKSNHINNALIVLNETEAKYEPREEAVVYYHMHQGEKIKLIRTMGLWHKIERKDGKLGWVKDQDVERIIND